MRKVRTSSAAVAVQFARKDHGRVVVVAHLGSAHIDAELGIFLEQARALVVGGQAAREFEAAACAQSMAGSYATAALNVGAATDPVIAAATLNTTLADLGPVWVSSILVAIALLFAMAFQNPLRPNRWGGTVE